MLSSEDEDEVRDEVDELLERRTCRDGGFRLGLVWSECSEPLSTLDLK